MEVDRMEKRGNDKGEEETEREKGNRQRSKGREMLTRHNCYCVITAIDFFYFC